MTETNHKLDITDVYTINDVQKRVKELTPWLSNLHDFAEAQRNCPHQKQNGRPALVGQHVPTAADPLALVMTCQLCQTTFTHLTVPEHLRVGLDRGMFGGLQTPWLDYDKDFPWRRKYAECGEYPIPVVENGVVVDYIYEPEKWYSRWIYRGNRRYQHVKLVLQNSWKILRATLRDL